MKRNRIPFMASMMTMISLLLSACNDDLTTIQTTENVASIQLSLPEPTEVAMRSTATDDECYIDRLAVVVYRGGYTAPAFYKEYSRYYGDLDSRMIGNTTNSPRFNIGVDYTPLEGDRIYLIANRYGETGGITNATTEENLKKLELRYFGFADPDRLPMSGHLTWHERAAANVCVMKRAVAKIELQTNTTFAGKDVTWTIEHSTSVCRWIESDTLPHTNYKEFDPGLSWYGETQNIYIPEYENSDYAAGKKITPATKFAQERICVILNVDNSEFYRLDFHQNAVRDITGAIQSEERYLDIRRNCHYLFDVSKCLSQGYSSKEEALNNPGSNIEYVIRVDEPDNTTISNGQYALVSTNDDCIIYDENVSDGIKDYVVATVRAELNGEEKISTNSITVDGASLKTPGLKVSETDTPITLNGFWGNPAVVTIQYGNITKTISVYTEQAIDVHPTIKTIEGQLIDLTVESSELCGPVLGINNTGSFRLCFPENVTPTNADAVHANDAVEVEPLFTERVYTAYANRLLSTESTDKTITKIIARQLAPNYIGWFGNKGMISRNAPYTYYDHRLIGEVIEEASALQLYADGIDSDYLPTETEDGKSNTIGLVALQNTAFAAARYCYMKNDRNGNGMIDTDEPIEWYMPSQNQQTAIWIAAANYDHPYFAMPYFTSNRNIMNDREVYCALTVYMDVGATAQNDANEAFNVRCVRDIY